MTDHLVDDQPQEAFEKIGVEMSLGGKLAEPRDLHPLALGVDRGDRVRRLPLAHLARRLESLREQGDDRPVDIVDAVAPLGERIVVGHFGASLRLA